jgi:CRP/FNR family transcriptional regulator, cyclic AMP receptor protein
MNDIDTRIAAHPVARSLSDEAFKVIAAGAREEVFEPGHVILQAQGLANNIYLIEQGKVAIEAHDARGTDRLVQTIGAGGVLGWSWLFAPFRSHFQARALERTRVIRLDGAHVLCRCEADHQIGYEIMKRVAEVLIERLQAAITLGKP